MIMLVQANLRIYKLEAIIKVKKCGIIYGRCYVMIQVNTNKMDDMSEEV